VKRSEKAIETLEAKQKKQSERNTAKISKKNTLKRNEGKNSLYLFSLWSEAKNMEAKRKEKKNGSETN
jgi:hypothetical protein